jgi:hypothetical protein
MLSRAAKWIADQDMKWWEWICACVCAPLLILYAIFAPGF